MSTRSQGRTLLRRIARRVFLGWFAAVVTIVGTLTLVDNWRKRIRPRGKGFPLSLPADIAVGESVTTVFTYGDDLYADMLAAIRGATTQVFFESYIWKGDALGKEFKAALIDAADRGVRVFVIYDGFANMVVPRSFKTFPASIHVLRYPIFRPGLLVLNLRKSGRDHRKILVVDEQVGFVGGYNIGSTYATQWRDTHVKITGPSAWDLQNAFIDFWNQLRADDQPTIADHGARTWEARIRAHRNVPWQLIYPIRGMYLEAIDRATDHIYITQAYFIPDREILQALLKAAERGVDVRILMPEQSNHVLADWLSRGFYTTMLRGGITMWLYQDAMVHAKTATIDGRWTTIGTANIDRLSLSGNYEINVEFFDDDLAAQMETVFMTDSTNTRELRLQEWSRRSVVAKASELILAPLRPFL